MLQQIPSLEKYLSHQLFEAKSNSVNAVLLETLDNSVNIVP